MLQKYVHQFHVSGLHVDTYRVDAMSVAMATYREKESQPAGELASKLPAVDTEKQEPCDLQHAGYAPDPPAMHALLDASAFQSGS